MAILSGQTSIVLAAAAGAAVIGGVAWFEYLGPVAPQAAPETRVALVPAEHADEKATPPAEVAKADPPAAPEIAPTPAPRILAFDEVRREEDGVTIIAGRAEPGATVQVLLDGAQINTTRADSQGKFVAITMIAPDGQGHVLSLLQIVDQEELASADQIILAPLDPPVVVAAEEETAVQSAALKPSSEPTPPVEASDPTDVLALPKTPQIPELLRDVTAVPSAPEETSAPEIALNAEVVSQSPALTPDPNGTAQVAKARPDAPTVQLSQPVLRENAGDDEINIASQASEIEVKTPQPTGGDAVATPTPESQPTPDASAPKPQVALLKTTEDGVELLNAPRPEALDNVALDTISYSERGDVQLTGRAQSDTRHVQVYLDNSSVVTLSVDAQGRWRGDLPDVDEGIYTLRVDEVAQDGRITSRVETPFKREAPEVLAEAAARADGPLKQITVQKGATLWAIAQERYGDGLLYVNVFQANADDIRDPDLIYPGQVFALPE